MILTALAAAPNHLHFDQLGLSPVALKLGFFDIKWYSLAYISGILLGWWYLLKLIAQPGSPMARRHQLNWLRIHDYLACCVPFGLFFGRLANFVNGELWGKPSDVAWAIVFPRTVLGGLDPARHPSQLYEAGLEGILLFAILWFAFWRTKARYDPGKLVGLFLLFYGLARFTVEFFREPDSQFAGTFFATTIHMGQILTLPMIVGGIYLIATSKARRQRVESIAGSESVA